MHEYNKDNNGFYFLFHKIVLADLFLKIFGYVMVVFSPTHCLYNIAWIYRADKIVGYRPKSYYNGFCYYFLS